VRVVKLRGDLVLAAGFATTNGQFSPVFDVGDSFGIWKSLQQVDRTNETG
jgi:hypothetical protein